jgi:hypothetical protein
MRHAHNVDLLALFTVSSSSAVDPTPNVRSSFCENLTGKYLASGVRLWSIPAACCTTRKCTGADKFIEMQDDMSGLLI